MWRVGCAIGIGGGAAGAWYWYTQRSKRVPPKVLMLGAPGSGKGTQCAKLSAHYGVPHISSGDVHRAEVKKGTKLGQTMQDYMSRGELVPDEIAVGQVLRAHLEQDSFQTTGWLGDGWTRERANSESLLKYGLAPSLVISLEVPREVLIKRLSGRRLDPDTNSIYHAEFKMPADPAVVARLVQRKDDKPEAIEGRLNIFESQRAAALAPLQHAGIPIRLVDGDGKPDEVFQRISDVWDSHFVTMRE